MALPRPLAVVRPLVAALVLAACSDLPTAPTAAVPAAVLIEGGAGLIGVGDSVALAARVVDEDGRAVAGAAATWRSLAPDVATVDATGKVHGVEAGVAAIIASAGDVADTISFRVEVVARRLDFVAASAHGPDSALVGNPLNLYVVVRDGRGRILQTPTHATFSVDDTSLATAPVYSTASRTASSQTRTAGRVTYTARLGELTVQRTVVIALVPIAVRSLGLTGLALGGVHGCGLDAGGVARCWGHNWKGALGRPIDSTQYAAPLAPVVGAPTFAQLVAQGQGTCGITAARRVWCWGEAARPRPAVAPIEMLPGVDVAQVAIGRGAIPACARTTVGEVWCWGPGYGASTGPPVRLETPLRFTAIGVGAGTYGCGLLPTGGAACWTGPTDPVQPIAGISASLASIGVSESLTCALGSDGTTWCWNGIGQATATATDLRFTQLVAGDYFSCGLTNEGQAWCWGAHPQYVVTQGFYRTRPVRIARDERFVRLIPSGTGVCGVREDGDLRCEGFYMSPEATS